MMSKMISHYTHILFYSCVMLLTSACVLNDMSDLDAYKEEVLARPGGRIEPLPEIKPYEAYTYKSGQENARDPFLAFNVMTQEELEQTADTGLSDDMKRELQTRNREELERFELDSLRMVGTIEDAENNWGIILDPEGTVHRVRVGNYLGANVGKILNIFEDRIELREIVRNSSGKWEERQAAIALAE